MFNKKSALFRADFFNFRYSLVKVLSCFSFLILKLAVTIIYTPTATVSTQTIKPVIAFIVTALKSPLGPPNSRNIAVCRARIETIASASLIFFIAITTIDRLRRSLIKL